MMKKKYLYLLLVLLFVGATSPACQTDPVQPEENTEEETELTPLKGTVPVLENWVFEKRPTIQVHVENPNAVSQTADIKVVLQTDKNAPITTVEKSIKVAGNGEIDITIVPDVDLDPGFYRAQCRVNGIAAKIFVFGISPFDIVSAPDKQPDYDAFWEEALNDLPEMVENVTYSLTEIPKKCNANCKVYFVEFQSAPDGPGTQPAIIHGYYLEPQDGKPHPVILHFQGYDTLKNPSKIYSPSGNGGEYAEFYLSHRGQYINHRTADKRDDGIDRDFVNTYGDWFAFNFGKKEGYYYRGAFMDCVQTVHFMATRSTSDMSNLFAEGSSQGGALCYAAAALSDYPFTAIAPNVAFLGDFPDYFDIVGWPGNVAKANQGSMTDDEMFAFLSYFDTKNLATRISCAVYATSGLQDGTCPPHTNMAPYNNLLSTDKQMHFYPLMQHSYPANWNNDIMKFFKERIK